MSLFPKFQNREGKCANRAIPANSATFNVEISENSRNSKPMFIDVFNPETKKTPRPDLLTEVELEAFNGWYATCRKPKFGQSHKEATQTAWGLLMESMEVMCVEGRGRYAPKNLERKND
jgi:hypothetical protein